MSSDEDNDVARTQFQMNYKEGSKLVKRKYYLEASKHLKKAKQKFNTQQDQFQEFVDMMIDLSRAYRNLYNFEKAKETLIECKQKIKKIYPFCQDQQVEAKKKQYECKILSEHGQIINAQAEKLVDKLSPKPEQKQGQSMKIIEKLTESQRIEIINDLKKLVEKSIDSYLKARNMAAANLVDNKNSYNKQLIQSWQVLYVSSIISSIDPVLLETQNTSNHLIYKLALKLAEKAAKLCSIFTRSDEIDKLISKTHYYQGSILLKTSSKYPIILKHLQFDYNFCLNKQVQLAETCRRQLINYHVCQCDHKQIKLLIKNNQQQNKYYNQDVVRVQLKLKKIQEQIRMENNMNTDMQRQKINKYMKIIQDSSNQWFAKFIPIAKQILPKIHPRGLRALIFYYLAKCYYQIFDETNALYFCQLCLNQFQQDLPLRYECLYLLYQIYWTNENQSKKLQTQNKLRALVKLFPTKEKEKQLNQNLSDLNSNLKRYKLFVSLFKDTQIEKTLFDEYERMKNKKAKYVSDMSDSNIQDDNGPKMNFTRQINNGMNKTQSLKQKYEALCQKNKVVVRQFISQELERFQNKQVFNLDFSIFHQIPTKELEIFLHICQTEEWDFRNVSLDLNFIQKFIEKISQKFTKALKIYNLSKSIKKETFNTLMRSLNDINQLHLQKLNKKYYIQTSDYDSFSLELPNPQKLKILKLKNCQINDDSLVDLCQRFRNLTQLDLASNKITGLGIQPINGLQHLEKLNLSYNPIESLNNLENENIKKLKIKCLKKQMENSQRLTQIKYCEILDISQNSNSLIQTILKMIFNQFAYDQILGPSSIEEIRIKKCNLSEQALKDINVLMAFLTNIKRLDLRFCCVERKKIQDMIKYQNIICMKKLEIDHRAIISQGYNEQK